MKRLAIITTHPIQYNAPLFKLLTERKHVDLKVFYTWGTQVLEKKYDPGFGKVIEWDIPLLEGYHFEFLENISKQPGSGSFNGIINPSVIQKIEGYKPDAILVFGWALQSHLKVLRHFKGRVPVIFRGDSTLLDEGKGVKTILRRLALKWVYRHVDIVLYVGTNNKNYFLKHGVKESKLVYAPHAIDNKRFSQPDEKYMAEARLWRQRLGISESDNVILFAGKFERKKNPEFVLELAKHLTDPNLKFILVGNGVLENELKQAAAGDDRIIFLDFVNQGQMPVVYRLGDVFILPSLGPGETWGLALNEAMASGRPVIASYKVGGAIDLIEDGKNGFMIDVNDPEESINKIGSTLQKKDVLIQMGMFSRNKIDNFSFENISIAIEKGLITAGLKV